MNYKEKKRLLNAFVVIYLLLFLLFNWEDVSWLFNYSFLSGLASDFFQKENYQALSNEIEGGPQYSQRKDSLDIPKIEISAPLVFGQSLNTAELEDDLDKGVVHYPSSVMPGQKGQTIILGHSAPAGWPKIEYDWVFNDISKLEQGDKIFLYFDNRKYSYSVEKTIFLDKGGDIPNDLTNNDNVLVLVSCWPPGKNIMRIAVFARLIKNYD